MRRAAPVRHIDPATFVMPEDMRARFEAGIVPPRIATTDPADVQWHPAFVSPMARSPERVEEFVQRLGFATWWPKRTELQKRPRRDVPLGLRGGQRWTHEAVQRPLWPRYILLALPRYGAPFARLSDEQAQAFGLYGVIRVGDRPAVVPDALVADLQRREADGEWDRTVRRGRKIVERPPDWAVLGARVQVTDGPFASFEAVIDEVIGERARVAVSIFGRATPVDVELGQLRPRR